ncbi:MAG TPA: ferredoxin reductase family protein [Candidatus Limnocylindria bacterium]|jgi:predicted ferric reductase
MAAIPTTLARVPMPRTWRLKPIDVAALLVGNGLFIAAMWWRHGGLDQIPTPGGPFIAAGQLTALLGTYTALVQLVLMSRSPWLDQLFGMHRLAAWHRWIGFATVWLLLGHGAFTTIGYAAIGHTSPIGELWLLLTTFPYVLMATAGMAMLIAVGVTSVRIARRKLAYETWHGIHLYGYLAIALATAHQLVVGSDFMHDPVARIYWISLYVAVAAMVLTFRVGQPIAISLRHRLRVANVVTEAPGVVSVYLVGCRLEQLAVRAGQYFVWRFLTRDGWWRGHPFSLSAAPNGEYLRLTIKQSGDYTRLLQQLRPGTRVFAEGPYGVLTGARRTRPHLLLIAGGIGIAPLRALLEELPVARGNLTLLYRASDWDDVVFRDEIDHLVEQRGGLVRYLVGRRGTREMPTDPLQARALRRLVPDIGRRDIYLCGSIQMMEAVEESLEILRVPPAQIHTERFSY